MFIELLQRHLVVCARADLPRIVRREANFWNVISMRGPTQSAIDRRGFRQINDVVCHDVVGLDQLDEDMVGLPQRENVEAVFRLVDTIAEEPILVDCMAGISRSTAIALAIIVRRMISAGLGHEEIVQKAPEILLPIRPRALPNSLILELALALIVPETEAQAILHGLLKHPGFVANRHHGGFTR